MKVSCDHVIGDRSKTNCQPFFVRLFIGKVEKGQEEDLEDPSLLFMVR